MYQIFSFCRHPLLLPIRIIHCNYIDLFLSDILPSGKKDEKIDNPYKKDS